MALHMKKKSGMVNATPATPLLPPLIRAALPDNKGHIKLNTITRQHDSFLLPPRACAAGGKVIGLCVCCRC